jgi:Ca-activated chloride channel homolog
MTPEERLTAYALNDPGLTAADRGEIETRLAADPAAQRAVAETRKVAEWLTAGLTAEQATTPAGEFVTVPVIAPNPRRGRWTMWAVAAAVLLAFAGGVGTFLQTSQPSNTFARAGSEIHVASTSEQMEGSRRESLAEARVREGIQTQGGVPTTAYEEYARKTGLVAGGGKGDGGDRPTLLDPEVAKKQAARGIEFPSPATGRSTPIATSPALGVPEVIEEPGRPRTRLSQRLDDANKKLIDEVDAKFDPYRVERKKSDAAEKLSPSADAVAPGDRYPALRENAFVPVEGRNALSTFGVDVDTASYSIVRKYLTVGQLPPANAVRLEELVNYFPYRDPAPDGDEPFAVRVEMAACPWQPANRLVRVGLKAKPVRTDRRPPSNLVFLIDVSGSMNEPNKLPLVKASLMMLLGQLGENDRVAVVVYAGASGMVLDSTPASKKAEIIGALDRLEAGGSTNGSGGLTQAYAVAAANFVKGGTNRVILCTDGDWNVGTTGTADLVKLVEEKRKTGVFLSVLGYGMGNLRDEMMVQLAGKGNGNYAYIDTAREANKALVEQFGGTLVTVAKDVKIQIEFNPAAVKAYRLLGYEKRILAARDFHDDTKDAGEMGAGHVVTALYELVPADGTIPGTDKVDDLRYQKKADAAPVPAVTAKADEAFVVKMRHKKPDGDVSTLRELPVKNEAKGYGEASEDFRFAAAVASFAMLLRDSPYKGNATYAAVQELADAARGHDPSGYRAEFGELVKRAKAVSGKP